MRSLQIRHLLKLPLAMTYDESNKYETTYCLGLHFHKVLFLLPHWVCR